MTDEEQPGGWLPPKAPGGQSPPQFDPSQDDPLAQPPPPLPDPPRPAPPPGTPPAAPAPPPGATGPWAGNPHVPLPPPEPRNDRAVLSLILGIGGFLAFLQDHFGLIFVLNLAPSIGAWITGVQAKRKVDRGETDQYRGVAQAGLILGVAGTVLGVVAVVAWTIALVTSHDVRHDLLHPK